MLLTFRLCNSQSCPKAEGQIILHMSQGIFIFFLGKQGRVIGNIHEKGIKVGRTSDQKSVTLELKHMCLLWAVGIHLFCVLTPSTVEDNFIPLFWV